MDLTPQLDKVTSIIDLLKKLSWGAIPIWLSLTIPILYITYHKLMPVRTPSDANETNKLTFIQKIKALVSLPVVDSVVIYFSLFLFVTGTITLMIDKNQKEKIRNNGLTIKEYMLLKNMYQINKQNLAKGKFKLLHLTAEDVDDVLKLYPHEFIELEQSTIVLCDTIYSEIIMQTSKRLLDNFLSNPDGPNRYEIDSLINENNCFTREIARKLIADSTPKYYYSTHLDTVSNMKIPFVIVNRNHKTFERN